MAEDLQRFLEGKPIEARPVSIFERSWKLILRHRMVSAATTVSFIAVVVALWMFVRPMAGTVPATITAENGDAELHFVRYNDVLHVPHESGFQVHAQSGRRVHLMPGLYLVKARDEEGRSHEVWRTVPELPSRALGDPRYPHRAWTIEDGTVVLQSFRLFSDQDVAEPLVMIKGGEFEAGIEKDDGLMRRHRQTVADFEAGVNEVSYGAFRKVLNQTVKSNSLKGTYLDQVNSQYGDRSSIANEMPVTGYPIDVAILYCELAGGRLPTSMEWEYLATLGGTAAYSTGDNPPVQKPDDWMIEALTAATADTTPSGVRHLCSSVAEYTDSRCLSYVLLYPEKFPENQRSRVSTEELARLPELIEVRGAPADWIKSGVAKDTFNPRQRNIAPFPGADQEALTNYGRIGWRMVRAID
ncbi:MAG: SUMF1/EgtB/PvdO family nonheme iron enzyme [Planctomycetaceae bacterium]